MSMLYEMNNNYYIRVGRKYVKVDMIVDGDDVKLSPNNKKVIEDNKSLKFSEVAFDDSLKKSIIANAKKRTENRDDEEIVTRNRYR